MKPSHQPILRPVTSPRGQAAPLGATLAGGGAAVNFSLFSRHATAVDLLLFDNVEAARPSRTLSLDRTHHYWHTLAPGVSPGQLYGYKVTGPTDPARGLRFDKDKLLLDPYARAVAVPKGYDRNAAKQPGDTAATAMKSIVVDPSDYDWEGDIPLRRPSSRTIIYEMHVRGFTRDPSSGVPESRRGTYAGLIDKIPYLQDLGITAVELLPVFQFDADDAPPGRVNYWGYQPLSFFSPHHAYSSDATPLGPVKEFRDMVKALHRAGIEVILDVVFNHTAEADHAGPTLGFRGIDNPTYYLLDPADPSRYLDFSGCGNTLNANHPVVRRLILDSIRYWVREMHVDGFRFDLASILARDSAGKVLPSPPVLLDLETDPDLAGTKLIAEAWDAAGLYQVGSFAGDSWKEWNGHFRDDARDFFASRPGSLRRFADRLVGSPEVYRHERREPEQSVNFVTCHDGFTLSDLVTYERKHNDANGHDNRDGAGDNRSWNCGVEGPSDDAAIEQMRNRQVKNFLAVTLLSVGVPMLLMGDEVRRTQKGNNNPYCLDDATNWFDWTLLEKHADVRRFVRKLCDRRSLRSTAHEERRLTLDELIHQAIKSWHGTAIDQPDWSDHSHAVAFGVHLRTENRLLHFILSAHRDPLTFDLPPSHDGRPLAWTRWIDTSLASPHDIEDWTAPPPVEGYHYQVPSHTVAVLLARTDTTNNAE